MYCFKMWIHAQLLLLYAYYVDSPTRSNLQTVCNKINCIYKNCQGHTKNFAKMEEMMHSKTL